MSLGGLRFGTHIVRIPAALLVMVAVGAMASVVFAEPAAPRTELTIDILMQRLADTRSLRARFSERKTLALLVDPLETEGSLYYVAPDRLARHIELPGPSTLVIHGDDLVFTDPAGRDRVDLGQSEVARQFVDNFIVLFNGDLAGLERRYRIEFRAEGEEWRIGLEPRTRAVRSMIESLLLAGSGLELRRMEVLETTGDRSVTTFDAIETNYAFGADELERLFAVDGSPTDDDGAPVGGGSIPVSDRGRRRP